jgi:hypothetical protein
MRQHRPLSELGLKAFDQVDFLGRQFVLVDEPPVGAVKQPRGFAIDGLRPFLFQHSLARPVKSFGTTISSHRLQIGYLRSQCFAERFRAFVGQPQEAAG